MLKSKDYFSAVRIFYSAARILPLSFLSSLIASPALCRTWIQCSYNCYCNLSGSTNICRPKMNQRSGLTAGLPLLPCPLKTLLLPSFHGDLAPDFPCLSTAPKNPKVNNSMLVASHLSCSEVTQASLHQYCCSSDQNNRCVVSLFHY